MIPSRHIILVGLSGSGKSTVGREMARKLERMFTDIDSLIEKKLKKSIAQVFEEDGERAFRIIEAKSIRQAVLDRTQPKVIALGGGALQNFATGKLIRKYGISVWLRCSIAELSKRLKNNTDRPLLMYKTFGNSLTTAELKLRLELLLRLRTDNYRKADIHVNTSSSTPKQISGDIIRKISKLYAAN